MKKLTATLLIATIASMVLGYDAVAINATVLTIIASIVEGA